MTKINNLEELKNQSMQVWAYTDSEGKTSTIESIADWKQFEKHCAYKGGVIAFILDGLYYATPYKRSVMNFLHEEGFKEDNFYVAFSSFGNKPISAQQNVWNNFVFQARKENEEDFFEDCREYSKNKIGITEELPKELLEKCLELPSKGIKVSHNNFNEDVTYYPIINSYCMDCTVVENLCHYNTNNGHTVFVYVDGKTYVTKSAEVREILQRMGFKQKSYTVPFSIGETILDPFYKGLWNNISK